MDALSRFSEEDDLTREEGHRAGAAGAQPPRRGPGPGGSREARRRRAELVEAGANLEAKRNDGMGFGRAQQPGPEQQEQWRQQAAFEMLQRQEQQQRVPPQEQLMSLGGTQPGPSPVGLLGFGSSSSSSSSAQGGTIDLSEDLRDSRDPVRDSETPIPRDRLVLPSASDRILDVEYYKTGHLGLVFPHGVVPLTINCIQAGGLAYGTPGLVAGMLLMGIQGISTSGLSYMQTLDRIKSLGRPIRLTFVRQDDVMQQTLNSSTTLSATTTPGKSSQQGFETKFDSIAQQGLSKLSAKSSAGAASKSAAAQACAIATAGEAAVEVQHPPHFSGEVYRATGIGGRPRPLTLGMSLGTSGYCRGDEVEFCVEKKSRFFGVGWDKPSGRWRASIRHTSPEADPPTESADEIVANQITFTTQINGGVAQHLGYFDGVHASDGAAERVAALAFDQAARSSRPKGEAHGGFQSIGNSATNWNRLNFPDAEEQVGFFPLFLRFSIGKCRNCPLFRAFY